MKKMIPSTLTLANLLLGFLAILSTFRYEFVLAALLILLGLIFDFFDGYCARKLNVASELGKELDSLADLVTFGIAPASLVFVASLHVIQVFGTVCCLVYVCCGALRLARFNSVQSHIRGFVGMPTPLAAVLVLLTTALLPVYAAAIGMLVIGALMISHFSFPSLKRIKTEVVKDC